MASDLVLASGFNQSAGRGMAKRAPRGVENKVVLGRAASNRGTVISPVTLISVICVISIQESSEHSTSSIDMGQCLISHTTIQNVIVREKCLWFCYGNEIAGSLRLASCPVTGMGFMKTFRWSAMFVYAALPYCRNYIAHTGCVHNCSRHLHDLYGENVRPTLAPCLLCDHIRPHNTHQLCITKPAQIHPQHKCKAHADSISIFSVAAFKSPFRERNYPCAGRRFT